MFVYRVSFTFLYFLFLKWGGGGLVGYFQNCTNQQKILSETEREREREGGGGGGREREREREGGGGGGAGECLQGSRREEGDRVQNATT